jgi:hypothetical protein
MAYPGMQQPQGAPIPNMGMPPEYSAKLFENLQGIQQGVRKAGRQQVMDNTARNPMMSGVQQSLLRQVNQGAADQALNQNTQVQLAGAEQGVQDRRILADREFQGQQNEQMRELERQKMRHSAAMQQAQQNYEDSTANTSRLASLLGGVAGAVGGPLLGGAGNALSNAMFGGDPTMGSVRRPQSAEEARYMAGH